MYANCYISFIFSTGNAPLESFETKEAAQKCPNVDAKKREEEQRETGDVDLQNGLAFCSVSTSLSHATLWRISKQKGLVS